MSEWPDFVAESLRRDETCVLVTVATTRGSTPREAGTRMVVFQGEALGTIGGGHLELEAVRIARELLLDSRLDGRRFERFALGPALGQCCGGAVQLLFERLCGASCEWARTLAALLAADEPVVMVTEVPSACDERGGHELERGRRCGVPLDVGAHKLLVSERGCFGELSDLGRRESAIARARELLARGENAPVRLESPLLFEPLRATDFHVVLFGAGHVGRAVVGVLGGLPCRVTWVDSRAEEFPRKPPANVRIELGDQPEFEIDAAPPGSHVLIMTHSHALDQLICERALRRDDLASCGLIGSLAKRRRFERRMRARGLPTEALSALTCPIGIDGISGKHPGEIAVAVCAELLRSRQRRRPVASGASDRPGDGCASSSPRRGQGALADRAAGAPLR